MTGSLPIDTGEAIPAFCKDEVTVAAGKDAPTSAPHPPQNFVESLTGAPHDPQNLPAGLAAGAGAGAAGTGVPQTPQNFSDPVTGFLHDGHTEPETAGGTGAYTGGGGWYATGAAARSSGTFTRHLLQNLSPGFIGLLHALQKRCPPAGWTVAGGA
jgi:hypothetical protein